MWKEMWTICGDVESDKKTLVNKMYKYTILMNKNKNIHLFHISYSHVDNFINNAVYNKEKYGYN